MTSMDKTVISPEPLSNGSRALRDHAESRSVSDPTVQQPWLTIFSIPKPFDRQTTVIQTNAIASWKQLSPHAEIILIGDEQGVSECATEWGAKHFPQCERNAQGTPLLSSAFEIAHRESTSPLLMYCNCDVILFADLISVLHGLMRSELSRFVAYGRRTDLSIDQEINFNAADSMNALKLKCRKQGVPASIVCKEYFAFRRETFNSIPPFAVGRGNWDNWMIQSSKQRDIPVVDLSSCVTAVHQNHNYAHVGHSRWKCYVAGDEARENQRLAGGKHLVTGSTPTWKFNGKSLRKVPCSHLNLAFWTDSFRFLRLVKKLVIG